MPGTFVYTPAAGTLLDAGSNQLLQVAFTPTEAVNYTTATASVAITVAATTTTPTLTWGAPADIVYGTALGAAQLTALASVEGTFIYTPAAGTVLNAAAGQTLSVAFTPADTINVLAGGGGRGDHGAEGAVNAHVARSSEHHLWHRARRGAVERDRKRAGDVRLHAGGGGRARRRQRLAALGPLYAGRCRQLHDGDRQRGNHRGADDAHDYVERAHRHCLRRSAGRVAAECNGERAGNVRLHAAGGDQAGGRSGRGAVGHLHPSRPAQLPASDGECRDYGETGDAGDHVEPTRRDHLRHCARRSAVECHGERAGDLCLHSASRDSAECRSRAGALGYVHANRRRQLHDGDRQCVDHGGADDAHDRLGCALEHHVWHRAQRHAVECDGECAGDLCLRAAGRNSAECRSRAGALGHVHAN